MGREIKRVPLNFDWPINTQWEGYLNPHYKKCPDCENGYSKAGQILKEICQNLVWSRHASLNQELTQLINGLCGRKPSILGYTCTDVWTTYQAIKTISGVDDEWGTCQSCKGTAIDPRIKKKYEEWKEYDPPTGEGWQLWENTTEGSPISPVFKTPEELATFLDENKISISGKLFLNKKEWLKMIKEDNFCYEISDNIVIM